MDKGITLTNKNYFSSAAEQMYMGVSQFKRFTKCEAEALAVLRGEWQEEKSTALLMGSYVDASIYGGLEEFQDTSPEIFTKAGTLRAEYQYANYIIDRIKRDASFTAYVNSGQHQKILTGEIKGVPVKIKIDTLIPGERIVDLKVMKDFDDVWIDDVGKLPFVEAWGYDIQAAIYQEIERQSRGADADPLPFGLAVATKEKPEPNIDLIEIPQVRIDSAMEIVKANIQHFDNLKKGLYPPARCEKCPYCYSTKILTGFHSYIPDDDLEY